MLVLSKAVSVKNLINYLIIIISKGKIYICFTDIFTYLTRKLSLLSGSEFVYSISPIKIINVTNYTSTLICTTEIVVKSWQRLINTEKT